VTGSIVELERSDIPRHTCAHLDDQRSRSQTASAAAECEGSTIRATAARAADDSTVNLHSARTHRSRMRMRTCNVKRKRITRPSAESRVPSTRTEYECECEPRWEQRFTAIPIYATVHSRCHNEKRTKMLLSRALNVSSFSRLPTTIR